MKYDYKSKNECEQICENTTIFNCRGYSITTINSTQVCLVHSEDSKLHGPKSLTETDGARYYEKARCLNSKFDCLIELQNLF